MRTQRAAARALLGVLIVGNACTTDFTGYHLESGEAGAPDADAGAGGSGDGDPAAGTGGSIVTAGASAGGNDALGGSAAQANAGGTSALGGGAGEPMSGGTGGSETPIVLLTGTPPSCQGLASACGPE